MPRLIVIEVDHEYSAELFWANLDQQFPLVVDQLRKGRSRAIVRIETWERIQQIEGFNGGPEYAPTALIRIS